MIKLEEQVNERAVSLIIKGTKITGKVLAKALIKLMAEMKKQKSKTYQGKQSLKNLIQQGKGVTNIEITDSNIKSFEKIARKYGVDFALKKDITVNPPKWLVFFKARDADALTAAFHEFSATTLKKSNSKPSVLKLIKKMKELSKFTVKDTVKNKDRELMR